MLKVRLMGETEEIKWFRNLVKKQDDVQVLRSSAILPNKGTNRFQRIYLEVDRRGK